MMLQKRILTLLSSCLVGALSIEQFQALGEDQTSDIQPKCFKQSYQINNSNDLKQISDCHMISGSIEIVGYDSELLDLGSISEVKGDLTVANASEIIRIEGLNLETIGGSFELNTLTSLTSAAFPKLEKVDKLEWRVLPIMSAVSLDKGIRQINSIVLSDTSLTGFGGFNVETLSELRIDNNRFLERVDSSVKEISGDLTIAANAKNLRVSLPELKWVKTAMVKDTKDLDLGELQVVQKTAEFIDNHFQSLSLPKLKSAGNTLSIIDNKDLSMIDFSSLTEVGGGLMIINNNQIKNIDFFPVLKSVGGAIEFEGDIDVSEFKKLKVVKGSAIMKSSSSSFDCNDWVDNQVSEVVRGGKIECGSGGSEVTEVVNIDENGERTRTHGRNDDQNSSSGRGDHKIEESNSASPSIGHTNKLLAVFACGLTLLVALELSY